MIEQVGIVGAGLMGAAVVAMSCAAGQDVIIFEQDEAKRQRLGGVVDSIIAELHANGLAEGPSGKYETAATVNELSGCNFIFEAVFEDLAVKQSVYRQLEGVVRHDAIIGSNTSNIIPSALAASMKHPERLAVVHFWNPPYAVPLVEIVPHAQTTAAAVEMAKDWVTKLGNTPVVLQKEVAGFVGNRLQYAMLREALWIVQQGIATPEEIDDIVTLSLGRRYAVIGPLATADLGGLDTFLTISRQLMPQLANSLEPLQVMENAVDAGHLGAKSGAGLLPWPEEKLQATLQRRQTELMARRRSEKPGLP
jgi:3-hydroxybutyryl-CoA dehydrogenase